MANTDLLTTLWIQALLFTQPPEVCVPFSRKKLTRQLILDSVFVNVSLILGSREVTLLLSAEVVQGLYQQEKWL